MADRTPDFFTEAYARRLDAADPLASFRRRFYLPVDTIYLDGNSLGLLSQDAEAAVLAALRDWRELGVDGWLRAEPPWFYLGEEIGALVDMYAGIESLSETHSTP